MQELSRIVKDTRVFYPDKQTLKTMRLDLKAIKKDSKNISSTPITDILKIVQLNNPYMLATDDRIIFSPRKDDIMALLGNTDGFKFNEHGIWMYEEYKTAALIRKLNGELNINLCMPDPIDSLIISKGMRARKMPATVDVQWFYYIYYSDEYKSNRRIEYNEGEYILQDRFIEACKWTDDIPVRQWIDHGAVFVKAKYR